MLKSGWIQGGFVKDGARVMNLKPVKNPSHGLELQIINPSLQARFILYGEKNNMFIRNCIKHDQQRWSIPTRTSLIA